MTINSKVCFQSKFSWLENMAANRQVWHLRPAPQTTWQTVDTKGPREYQYQNEHVTLTQSIPTNLFVFSRMQLRSCYVTHHCAAGN